MCCNPRGHKESDMTEQLNNINNSITHYSQPWKKKAKTSQSMKTLLRYIREVRPQADRHPRLQGQTDKGAVTAHQSRGQRKERRGPRAGRAGRTLLGAPTRPGVLPPEALPGLHSKDPELPLFLGEQASFSSCSLQGLLAEQVLGESAELALRLTALLSPLPSLFLQNTLHLLRSQE